MELLQSLLSGVIGAAVIALGLWLWTRFGKKPFRQDSIQSPLADEAFRRVRDSATRDVTAAEQRAADSLKKLEVMQAENEARLREQTVKEVTRDPVERANERLRRLSDDGDDGKGSD